MTIKRSAAALLCAFVLAACEKNAVQDITGSAPMASILFFNFGVGAPGVNFYANNTKMTAINSSTCQVITDANREQCTTIGAESTVGVNYGGVSSGARYSALDPGQYTFTGRIAAATDKDLPVATAQAVIADGKAYSFYMSGFYDATAKRVDAFVVEDNFPVQIQWDKTCIRYVNAIGNSQPMRLVISNPNAGAAPIGGLVAYKGASDFVCLEGGTTTLDMYAYVEGNPTPVLTRTAFTFGSGRVYTVAAIGDMTVGGTTAANRARLDVTANR